ncbi:MAG: nitrate/nitrite transporter [Promethearchaeota archaeon]
MNAAEAISDTHRSKWLVLTVTSVSALLAYIHVFMYPPLIPSFISELGLTYAEASLLIVSFGLAYTCSGVVWGHIINRYGLRWILFAGLLCISVPQFVISLLPPYHIMVGLRFILGLGVANIRVTGISYLHSWFPSSEVSRAIGIFNASVLVGMSIALGTPPILQIYFGWLFPFMFFSVISLFFIIVFVAATQRIPMPRQYGFEKKSEVEPKEPSESDESVYRNPAVWILGLVAFTLYFAVYAALSWIPSYIYEVGNLSEFESSIVLPFLTLVGIPASLVGGFLADRTRKRVAVMAIGLGINVSILILAGPPITNLVYLLGTLMVIGWGSNMSFGPCFTIPKDITSPGNVNKALGIVSTFAFSSAIIAPYIGGFLRDLTGSYAPLFVLTAAISVAGVIASLILKKFSRLD